MNVATAFPDAAREAASHPAVLPPSADVVPGKDARAFRQYGASPPATTPTSTSAASTPVPPSLPNSSSSWSAGVHRHYELMRRNQCVAFVERMEAKWCSRFDRASLTVAEAFALLKDYVDASDPDTSVPNIVHMLQSAEAARAAGKPDWFVLTALIHDLGKVVGMFGESEDGQNGRAADSPQFAIGGDTWVVGCALPDGAMILPHLNALNPDRDHPVFSTELGVYEEGCGAMSLKYAFGHDEYLYRVLRNAAAASPSGCSLPEEALAIIRLHSCYPLHTGGAYRRLLAPGDERLLAAVREFNSFDLYTKADAVPDVEALWPFYQGLIDRFVPGKLAW